jgi:hypothetical protein
MVSAAKRRKVKERFEPHCREEGACRKKEKGGRDKTIEQR